MKNKTKKIVNAKKGLSLIELMISIVIIVIILTVFMPLFMLSIRNNSTSDIMLNSTYLGKDTMELIYDLSRSVPYENIEDELVDNMGYTKEVSDNSYSFEYDDGRYLNIKFDETENGNLIKVIVKIYGDRNMNGPEAQYESLYTWVGRGILK